MLQAGLLESEGNGGSNDFGDGARQKEEKRQTHQHLEKETLPMPRKKEG